MTNALAIAIFSFLEEQLASVSSFLKASDGVFSDSATLELATVTGVVASGLTATLTVAI